MRRILGYFVNSIMKFIIVDFLNLSLVNAGFLWITLIRDGFTMPGVSVVALQSE